MNPLTPRRVVLVLALALTAATSVPANAQAKVPRDFLAISSVDTVGGSPGYRSQQLRRQRRVGIGMLRMEFHWSEIERQPGVYTWDFYDSNVAAAARHGMRAMPLIFDPPGFASTAPASGGIPGAMYPPRDMADIGHFAAVLAARYGRGGSFWRANPTLRQLPVHSWQVWNEPTLAVFWAPTPSAESYTRMLQSVSPSIKGIDPKAEILTAGLPDSKLGDAIPLGAFIRRMYAAGGASAFDTLAVNAYAPDTRGFARVVRFARRAMRRGRDRRARLFISEFGWATQGPRHRFRVGARGQARRLSSTLRWVGSNRKRHRLRGLLYFQWRDSRPYPPKYKNLWGLHTGLIGRSGRAKPALAAYRRAARRLLR